MSAVMHYSGGLSWWEGRWRISKHPGFAACREWSDAADTALGKSRVTRTGVAADVTCKRCLTMIAKAAANQEPTDPEHERAEEFIRGRDGR